MTAIAPLCLTLATLLGAAPAPLALESIDGCKDLRPALAEQLRGHLAHLHPYDGCDQTFEACLAREPVAPVVKRLVGDLCRQVQDGRSRAELERALGKRSQSVQGIGKPVSIVLDERTRAGDPDAPIAIAIYACARCPFCMVFVPALYREVTEGKLKGKARLYFRPFPIKEHPGANEGGLAMLAAARGTGTFWPFLLQLYAGYDDFDVKILPEWAARTGLDRAAFEQSLADPAVRQELVSSKQEGLRNKVAATPTVFIDGRRYVHDLKAEVVADVVLEIAERKAARGK